MVSAVITYRRRSALREASKALGIEVGTLSARKLERNLEELTQDKPKQLEQIRQMASELEDMPRHLSIHSGGFTLSADPIVEIVPVEPARMEKRTIIQWDKYDLDYLGLLKVDILGLGMLSALHKTLNLVKMNLTDIPPEDPKTYAMIQRADTVGTFQIESRAQMSMLGRLRPKTFYDLVIEIAIVRPGPIMGKMVHPYLRRRRGQEKIHYADPRLEKILGKTLGIPLFQEQVMRLAIELANFSGGEADELRRAIGAWRSSGSVQKMGQRLLEGLLKAGLPSSFAKNVFEQIQGFATYGFPESHAASFALIAYASCYLKCHYPAQFACSMINAQPLGFYAIHTIIDMPYVVVLHPFRKDLRAESEEQTQDVERLQKLDQILHRKIHHAAVKRVENGFTIDRTLGVASQEGEGLTCAIWTAREFIDNDGTYRMELLDKIFSEAAPHDDWRKLPRWFPKR